MPHPTIRLRLQKRPFHGIQDPQTGLFARITDDPPASPQPSEEGIGAVACKHGHIRFEEWPLATWFKSRNQAESAFAHYIGVAPLDIVRCDP